MELNKRDNSVSEPYQLTGNVGTESQRDSCYLQLIELIHLLGSAFVAPHFWEGGKTMDATFDQLMQVLTGLSSAAEDDGSVFIHENEALKGDSKHNVTRYTVQFGNLVLTTEKAIKVAQRSKFSVTQMIRKLQIAFDIFAINGIHDIFLQLPATSDISFDQIRISLDIISHFDQSVQSGCDISCREDGRQVTLPVIKDQKETADCNLTLFAALNHLSKEVMTDINQEVTDYIEKYLLQANPYGEYKIFNVICQINRLRERLILPPMEVNNLAFRLSDGEPYTDATAEANLADRILAILDGNRWGEVASDSDRNSAIISASEIVVSQIERTDLDEDSQNDSQVIDLTDPIEIEEKKKQTSGTSEVESDRQNSVVPENETKLSLKNDNAVDCDHLDSNTFHTKLNEAAHLLASLESAEKGEEILNGLIESLKYCQKMEQKGDSEGGTNDADASFAIIEKFQSRIQGILSRFKENSEIKSKKTITTQKGIGFQKSDPEKIAKRFDFSISETKNFLQLIEECFDARGDFIRSEFESRIPHFIAHQNKIFQFLWGYLKEPLRRKDRVAYLHSLYLLASKMEAPQKALSFLLDELYTDPFKISYSDRNAFMLASLLLRRYSKEFSVDIELTPGEVLLVKNGMNKEILEHALTRLKRDSQMIKAKLDTIHKRLIHSFDKKKSDSISWDPHFLLSLEREAFIFLSLVSGEPARQILISALAEYGNPKSDLYSHQHEDKFISLLLQHLKLLISSIGRVGDIEDIGILADLKKSENDFLEILADSQHEKNIGQVFRMIDVAMGNITSLQ